LAKVIQNQKIDDLKTFYVIQKYFLPVNLPSEKNDAMNFNVKEIATAGMILFAVIDILGSIPIILSLRRKVGHVQSEKASIVATCIMIAFLFVGESILKLIGIDVNSFAVAGAFIIFFLAIEMILGISLYRDDEPETASIVPIAFPLIAGAGTLTSILSLRAEYHVENIIVAIIINVIFVYIVLKSSAKIERILGKNGLNIIRKVFGVILMAIAVKLFATNVNELLSHAA
jgi:multiple antibiotic resistance protein